MKPQLERLSATLSDRYDVQRRVGAGGMATVYLAQDLRHHRKVAVKVLNPEIAEAVGRERFLREIEIAAGLHHPHVLPLFDSGEAAGLLFFVMPFVEGESLRERLDREKQLPVEEAIRIANEVADALDHAHRQDVIHRDIKPGNILLQEGRALVADFGIALAVDDAGSTRLTRTGVSPGTPEYMSPEQASGDWRIDARSDLYSLGCVVYEMLAGEPPHTGPTRQSVLARKLAERPRPVAELRESVPAHVDAALARVLERLPADRFSTAKEFRAALESSSGFVMTPERRRFAPDHTGRAWKLRFMMASAVAVVAGIAAATAWLGPFRAPAAEASVVRRWSILLPDTAPLAFIGSASLRVGRRALEISPDGSTIAFIGQEANTTRLYVRPVGAYEATPVPGSDGAFAPFFSPDGRWIAFFSNDLLRKVALSGGDPLTLASAPNPTGGAWAEDGWIAFGVNEGQRLLWIPEDGGNPVQRHVAERAGLDWWEPSILPGGSAMIYHAPYGGVSGLFMESGERLSIVPGFSARFASSGHLIFQQSGQLWAVPFDPGRLEANGSPVPVLDGIRVEASGAAQYAVSPEGTLVYASGTPFSRGRLAWVRPGAAPRFLSLESASYGRFDLSPDGRRLVVSMTAPGVISLLAPDTARPVHLTNDGQSEYPLWAPDGRTLVLRRSGDTRLFRKSAEGGEPPQPFTEAGLSPTPTSWSPDGRVILLDVLDDGSWSIWRVAPGEEDKSEPFLSTPANEWGATFSPDGQWVAYTSDEPGRFEVFVEPFPRTGHRWQISTEGGEEPCWAREGSALFYRDGPRLMMVNVINGRDFRFDPPRVFLEEERWVNIGGRSFVVSPDGSRALVILGPEERSVDRLNVVEGWLEEVRRIVGSGPG